MFFGRHLRKGREQVSSPQAVPEYATQPPAKRLCIAAPGGVDHDGSTEAVESEPARQAALSVSSPISEAPPQSAPTSTPLAEEPGGAAACSAASAVAVTSPTPSAFEEGPQEWLVYQGMARQKATHLESLVTSSSSGHACLVADPAGSVVFFGVVFPKEWKNSAPEWSACGQLKRAAPAPEGTHSPADTATHTWGVNCPALLRHIEQGSGLVQLQLENRCQTCMNKKPYDVKVQCKLELLQHLASDPSRELRAETGAVEKELREFVKETTGEGTGPQPGTKGKSARILHSLRSKVDGLKESICELDGGVSEPRRVCVIGATGTGKSSLVNALLSQRVALSAGGGKAVTSVPTEYHHVQKMPASNSIGSEHERLRTDVVGATLQRMALFHGGLPKSRFVGTLQFLGHPELKQLLETCIDDLTSPIVTKTEKERECLPLLRVLFKREVWESVLERFNVLDIGPDTPDDMCALLKDRVLHELVTILNERKPGGRPGPTSLSIQKVNIERPVACDLQGCVAHSALYSLQTLQDLESHYWRVLDHVEIGSPGFKLLQVPEAGGDVRLVDVPGFGDECGLREKIAERYLNLADKILVCAACARAGSDRQTKEYLRKDALQELQMKRAGRDSIIFCATKSDQAQLQELQELDAFEEDATVLRSMHSRQVRENVRAMLVDFKYGKDIPVAVISAERYWQLGSMAVGGTPVSPDGFSLEATEVPRLARLVFRSVWSDAAGGRTRVLEDLARHCGESLEDVAGRLKKARAGETAAAAAGSSADEVAEAVRAAIRKVGQELEGAAGSGGMADALAPFLRELSGLEGGVQAAARSCDRAAPGVASGWSSLHWATYAATLKKHGEHEGVAGKQDFHADLFRAFRGSLQDRGWSEFFEQYRGHLQAFKEVVSSGWASFAEKIVAEIAAAQQLPAGERREVAREVERKAQSTAPSLGMHREVTHVVETVKQLQDTLEVPKDHLRTELGPRFHSIAVGESGTGSHKRRQARVAALLGPGCGMGKKTEELAGGCAAVERAAAALPTAAAQALQKQAAELARGSWSVDFSECPICTDADADPERPWSIFPCFHGGHEDCVAELLRSRPRGQNQVMCPICRGRCCTSDITTAARRDAVDPVSVLTSTERVLSSTLESVERVLRRRREVGEENTEGGTPVDSKEFHRHDACA